MEKPIIPADTGNGTETWLSEFLSKHGAVSGTVHLREGDGLKLVSALHIPEKVLAIIAWVPSGKGMAGLALERGVPIETCNLKEDNTGSVRPGAKAVDARAAVAIPVKAAGGVRAVVGIAFADERRFSAEEMERLTESASTLP